MPHQGLCSHIELNICELIDHNSDIQVDCGGTDVSEYEKEPEYFGSHDIVGIDDDFLNDLSIDDLLEHMPQNETQETGQSKPEFEICLSQSPDQSQTPDQQSDSETESQLGTSTKKKIPVCSSQRMKSKKTNTQSVDISPCKECGGKHLCRSPGRHKYSLRRFDTIINGRNYSKKRGRMHVTRKSRMLNT